MTETSKSVLTRSFMPATIRNEFPLLRNNSESPALAYLDNAATTQKPQPVLDAIMSYYGTVNSNVGRGYHRLGLAATERLEQARAVVQRAIGAARPEEVVFTRGTTDAVNLVAEVAGRRLVGRGDRVVVTGMEHNSNLLPWRRLCDDAGAQLVVASVAADGRVDMADFSAALGSGARIAAMAHVSNVLGTVNPITEMVAEARRCGALTVVDGAQAVAHRAIDVAAIGADFYCFSAHKVYGPMGIGVLHGRSEVLAELPPYQVGGGTVKAVSFAEPVSYIAPPARLEAGTPDVAGVVGLAAALTYLEEIGWERIRRHDESLVRTAVARLTELDRVRVVGDPAYDPSGIVSITLDGLHPYDVGGHLDQHNIAVRCGVHCASTFLDSLGLVGTVRISFGIYNTEEEISRVCEALRTVRPGFWTREHPTTRFL
ncbi:aminotransferase class V-fold PLP-dependent enzyme [Micromonospora sp. LOL_021]|uniref:aminotransferase class V-fold PLP-dependent enzyme n=1 Tax=Micromonospora sp. LOL_021 TaxID=3345417 RepID=UPI003A83B236